jgi:hypothetical protein
VRLPTSAMPRSAGSLWLKFLARFDATASGASSVVTLLRVLAARLVVEKLFVTHVEYSKN